MLKWRNYVVKLCALSPTKHPVIHTENIKIKIHRNDVTNRIETVYGLHFLFLSCQAWSMISLLPSVKTQQNDHLNLFVIANCTVSNAALQPD